MISTSKFHRSTANATRFSNKKTPPCMTISGLVGRESNNKCNQYSPKNIADKSHKDLVVDIANIFVGKVFTSDENDSHIHTWHGRYDDEVHDKAELYRRMDLFISATDANTYRTVYFVGKRSYLYPVNPVPATDRNTTFFEDPTYFYTIIQQLHSRLLSEHQEAKEWYETTFGVPTTNADKVREYEICRRTIQCDVPSHCLKAAVEYGYDIKSCPKGEFPFWKIVREHVSDIDKLARATHLDTVNDILYKGLKKCTLEADEGSESSHRSTVTDLKSFTKEYLDNMLNGIFSHVTPAEVKRGVILWIAEYIKDHSLTNFHVVLSASNVDDDAFISEIANQDDIEYVVCSDDRDFFFLCPFNEIIRSNNTSEMNLYTIDAYHLWQRLLTEEEFEQFRLADYRALLAFDEKSDYTGRYMSAHNKFIVNYSNIRRNSISTTFAQHLIKNKRYAHMLPSEVLKSIANDESTDLLFRCMLNAVDERYDISECLEYDITPDELSKIRLTYAEYDHIRKSFRIQEYFEKVSRKLHEYQEKGKLDSKLKLIFDEHLGRYAIN